MPKKRAYFILFIIGLQIQIGLCQPVSRHLDTDSLLQVWEDEQGDNSSRSQAILAFLQQEIQGIPSDSVLGYSQNLIQFAQEQNIQHARAWGLLYQGMAYFRQKKLAEAIESYRESLPIMEAHGDSSDIADVHKNWGLAHYRKREYPQAQEHLEQSRRIYQSIQTKKQELGETLRILAALTSEMGDSRKAQDMFAESIRIFEQSQDQDQQAKALNGLAITYANQGQFEQAADYFSQSLEIRKHMQDTIAIASLLGNLGILNSFLGRYEEAIDYYEKSIAIKEAQKDYLGLAKTLGNAGAIYHKVGKIPEAMSAYRRGLRLYEEAEDPQGISQILANIGFVYDDEGKLELAKDAYKQSLAMKEEIGEKKGIGIGLHNLALIYEKEQNYEEAISYYRRALDIQEEMNDQVAIGNSWCG